MTGYNTESTCASDHGVKENIVPHPTRESTVDADTTQGYTLDKHKFNSALVQITPKPTITKAKVRKNDELSFIVSVKSPVWVSYSLVRDDHCVKAFLKTFGRSKWKRFVMNQETRRRKSASLGYGPYGEQMEIEKVFQMKRWDDRWIHEIIATGLELDLDRVHRIGLVDDAVEFLYENGGDAHVLLP